MYRIILLILTIILSIPVQSQEDNVVIDGVIFSADRKTLIEYPREKTNTEYVIPEGTEVIGEYAFDWNPNLQKISIPTSLNEIRNVAFWGCVNLSTIIWGTFPEVIGDEIFRFYGDPVPINDFLLSDNNTKCILLDGILFSIDKKILFLVPPAKAFNPKIYTIPEGTEIIGKNAFYGVDIEQVTLPSSLKSIEDYAFWSYASAFPTRSEEEFALFSLRHVISNAITPPAITRKTFPVPRRISLTVPEDAYDNYISSDIWKWFSPINGKVVSLENTIIPKTVINVNNDKINIVSGKNMHWLKVFIQNGTLLVEKSIFSNTCSFDLDESIHGVFLLEICYEDGTKEVFKLIKQ